MQGPLGLVFPVDVPHAIMAALIGTHFLQDARDIVIVISGGIVAVATVLLLFMTLVVYRKVSSLLDSIRSTVNGVETFSRTILQPVGESKSVLSAAWKVVSWLTRNERAEQPQDRP